MLENLKNVTNHLNIPKKKFVFTINSLVEY